MDELCEVRPERPSDVPLIYKVNEAAFGRPDEAKLVDALRVANASLLSLVAIEPDSGDIIGHILFSPVTVQSDSDSFQAVGLGPMAVMPQHQLSGTGTALVRAGLIRLREDGHEAVVVLGHPTYYPRFGFERASTFGLRWEKSASDAAFMVLELTAGALRGRRGIVRYRPEFGAV
jgi:putative acetyltransferase